MDSVADFRARYKKLQAQLKADGPPAGRPPLRIALLASFTIGGLMETLFVKCASIGVLPEIYVGNYDQYAQEIIDPASGYHKFGPDLTILMVDGRNPTQVAELARLVELAKAKGHGKILVHNFEVPVYSPLGILDSKQSRGRVEEVETMNAELRGLYKQDPSVFVFDFNGFCSYIGKKRVTDWKYYYLADMRISMEHFPELAENYLAYIKPLVGILRKCIVLDLDNTLWGGVIGEDGLEGIKLGPTPEGRPFVEFQRALLALRERGIILAINSKNNEAEALEAISKHPHMVLREKHFAAKRINWKDKATNLKEIAAELNIGVDSLVFVDDDAANCGQVRQMLPEVLVVELPRDPALYVATFERLNDFNSLQLTAEDLSKGRMYEEERRRTELKSAATDVESYLKDLELKVTIAGADDFTIPRIAQLTQKTNQFNMTTRRYSEDDIRRFSRSPGHVVLAASVEDRFGDSGLTGVVIVEKRPDHWLIDTFLLSCRVLGRKVEQSILAVIHEAARKASVGRLRGLFAETAKNAPAKGFFKDCGFVLVAREEAAEVWERDLSREFAYPAVVNVIKEVKL